MGQECYCSATICQKGCQIQNSGPVLELELLEFPDLDHKEVLLK